MLTVVGLGPAGAALLTREAADVLAAAPEVWVRTRRHPAVDELVLPGRLRSFDAEYRRGRAVAEVYQRIADRLVKLARRRAGVVYAVPGDPMVAERSVRLALDTATAAGVPTRIVSGVSFLEPTFAVLGLDPLRDGLQIVDAASIPGLYFGGGAGRDPFAPRARAFDATRPALLTQVDSRHLAGLVKVALLEMLPPEHPVAVVSAAGSPTGRVEHRALHELDRAAIDHLTSVFVPARPILDDTGAFETLRHIVARLRAPNGCPWDREQTQASLKATLIEEAYEAIEAIDRGCTDGDWSHLAEELGDLMMNIVLSAQIGAENGAFWLDDVLRGVGDKLVRRHPHVFGDVVATDTAAVLRNWDRIKRAEKRAAPEASRLGQIPISLPSLARAQTLQRRAARTGFAWPNIDGAWTKLDEELAELRAADSPEERAAELGDVLFVVAGLANYLGVDAEEALRQTSGTFTRRFNAMEQRSAAAGDDFTALDLAARLALWNAAKQAERRTP